MEQTEQMEAAVLRGFLTEKERSEWKQSFSNTTGNTLRAGWRDESGAVKGKPQG